MAASANLKAMQKLMQQSTILKRGAEYARQEIFGHRPQLNMPSGNKTARNQLTGPYLEKYYPISINTYARKVRVVVGTDEWSPTGDASYVPFGFGRPRKLRLSHEIHEFLFRSSHVAFNPDSRGMGNRAGRIQTRQAYAKTAKGQRSTKEGSWSEIWKEKEEMKALSSLR
jgi:hypothetical protein